VLTHNGFLRAFWGHVELWYQWVLLGAKHHRQV
jgi:hypothetical protein